MKTIFEALRAEINKTQPETIIAYGTLLRAARTACYYRGIENTSRNTVYAYLRTLRKLGYLTKVRLHCVKVVKHIPEDKSLKDFRAEYKKLCNLKND